MTEIANNLPATLQEAARLLQGLVPEVEQSRIAGMKEEALTLLHFGLGQWIRNNLGLWQKESALLAATGESHPDDASAVIITALWHRLREDLPRVH
jgi:hypothetical protein